MKILLVSDVPLNNPTSGSEQVLYSQAIGLQKKNCDVYAITRNNLNLSYNNLNNVGSVHNVCYSVTTQNYIKFLISTIKKPVQIYNDFDFNEKFSVYICHQPFTLFSLLIQKHLRRAPILYVFHSPNHEEYKISNHSKINLEGFLQAQIRKIIEYYCLKKSQKIMVLSSYMKRKIQKIHKIPAEKIIVNSGGVDLENFRFSRNRSEMKKKLNFPPDKIHLLTVRNLEPRMGLDSLLKAIFILKDKLPNLFLIVGGEGPEKFRLEKLVEELCLTDHVRFTGFIPVPLLPKYYSSADFFILPTRKLEGFGLVTPESMACGTPVLGTPIGGTNEILLPFNSNLLFKDSSPEAMAEGIMVSIKHYFYNQKKYKNLRLKSREYVEENYSWERHIGQLKEIINEIVSLKQRSVN